MCPQKRISESTRRPHEEWEDYVKRLEESRIATLALKKGKEVKALKLAAEKSDDPDLHIAANKASIDFKNMLRKLDEAANS